MKGSSEGSGSKDEGAFGREGALRTSGSSERSGSKDEGALGREGTLRTRGL